MDGIPERLEFAVTACRKAGELALSHFSERSKLEIDRKGHQDWVSQADKDVETFLRKLIAETWPGDGIVGEEHADVVGESGFTWVIDPIDGTTNFINGIPAWTIVLAGVVAGRAEIGVIHDPNVAETFATQRGRGATLNGSPMSAVVGAELANGTVAVGYSNRVTASDVVPVVAALIERGAMFHRNASGALSLAYVAAGRLLGYVEQHMNAWDCLAGQLMVAEAGGGVEVQDADAMIREGGRVIVGASEVFDTLVEICDAAWER